MASLTIRNIPEEAKQRFRERAAAHGRSMEDEARQLILAAVTPVKRPSIGELLYQASRPGIEIPEVHDTPASYVVFDE